MDMQNPGSRMKIPNTLPLDDSHLDDGEDPIHIERVMATRRLAQEMEEQGDWGDEIDLRAELNAFYTQYNALERRRLRLVYRVQQLVLTEGRANVDPGALVMILNLARMG